MPVDQAQKEREFWLRVILRAQAEASGRYLEKGDDPRMVRYLARKWLTRCSREFRRVCDLAGLNEHQITLLVQQSREQWNDSKKQ